MPVKDGAPSGRILLADLWWRNRSGKNWLAKATNAKKKCFL